MFGQFCNFLLAVIGQVCWSSRRNGPASSWDRITLSSRCIEGFLKSDLVIKLEIWFELVMRSIVSSSNHFANVSVHNDAFIKVSDWLNFQSVYIIKSNPGTSRMQIQMPIQASTNDPGIPSNNKRNKNNKNRPNQKILFHFLFNEISEDWINSLQIASNSKRFSRFIILLGFIVTVGFIAKMWSSPN